MRSPDISIAVRLLGGLVGTMAGGGFGVVVLIAAMIFSGATFGLSSVLPGAVIGAGFGFLLGFCFPRAAGRAFAALLSSI